MNANLDRFSCGVEPAVPDEADGCRACMIQDPDTGQRRCEEDCEP